MKQAKDRLELLYKQREAINNEIASLEHGIEGFAPLVESVRIGPGAGVTESVRQVLKRERNRVFAATEVRDELLNKGLSLEQKNPMATIHQILARLVNARLVTVHIHDGKNGYRWIGPDGKDDVMKRAKKTPK